MQIQTSKDLPLNSEPDIDIPVRDTLQTSEAFLRRVHVALPGLFKLNIKRLRFFGFLQNQVFDDVVEGLGFSCFSHPLAQQACKLLMSFI